MLFIVKRKKIIPNFTRGAKKSRKHLNEEVWCNMITCELSSQRSMALVVETRVRVQIQLAIGCRALSTAPMVPLRMAAVHSSSCKQRSDVSVLALANQQRPVPCGRQVSRGYPSPPADRIVRQGTDVLDARAADKHLYGLAVRETEMHSFTRQTHSQ